MLKLCYIGHKYDARLGSGLGWDHAADDSAAANQFPLLIQRSHGWHTYPPSPLRKTLEAASKVVLRQIFVCCGVLLCSTESSLMPNRSL